MIGFRYGCILVGTGWLSLLGCATARWPRLVDGGRYEVHNPSPCTAQIYTVTDDNVTRRYLGRVPSGGRLIVTVPPRSEGTRVAAMSLYPDGTNCDVGAQIRVRAVRS